MDSAAEDSGSYSSQICRQALIVFDISIAIVIGPDPAGNGSDRAGYFRNAFEIDVADEFVTSLAARRPPPD